MGYQVGHTCYSDVESAENAYFSQISPVITEKGILQVQKTHNGWYFQGNKIHAHLAHCSPEQNFYDGFQLGAALIPTAVVLGLTLILLRVFK